MTVSMTIAVLAYSLSCLGFIAFAAGFGLRKEWETWHGQATEKNWADLSEPLQLVILSIMRAAAAGGLALAVTTAVLVYRLIQGDAFAVWALPLILLAFALPAAFTAFNFRAQSAVGPPMAPVIVGTVLPVVGFIATRL